MKSESWIFGPLQPGKVNRITQPHTMASNRAVVPRSRLLPSLRAAGIDFLNDSRVDRKIVGLSGTMSRKSPLAIFP